MLTSRTVSSNTPPHPLPFPYPLSPPPPDRPHNPDQPLQSTRRPTLSTAPPAGLLLSPSHTTAIFLPIHKARLPPRQEALRRRREQRTCPTRLREGNGEDLPRPTCLAETFHQKLVVYNLKSQTESSDIIGWFKPVKPRLLYHAPRTDFLVAFTNTTSTGAVDAPDTIVFGGFPSSVARWSRAPTHTLSRRQPPRAGSPRSRASP